MDDPHNLLGALRGLAERSRPPCVTSRAGLHYDLETLLEHVAMCKNAWVEHDEVELLAAAREVAEYATLLLFSLNGVESYRGERERRRALTLPVAPPGWRADLALCAGYSTDARPLQAAYTAALRLAAGVVRLLMERGRDPPIGGELERRLHDGTVLRYLRQGME